MIKWIATFILLWFIYQVREVFPPIIVGGIIAYLLLPLVNALAEKAKIPVSVATLIIYVMLAGILSVVAWQFIPGLVAEVMDLGRHRHEIIEKVIDQLKTILPGLADSSEIADHILGSVSEGLKPTELAHVGGAISHGALALLVCVVSSVYITIDSGRIGAFLLQYLPEERREEAKTLTGQANRLLSKYVQGQLILITLMSTVAFLFLNVFMHMKYSLPVALLCGFLEIIPVLGPILAISTAVLVAVWQLGMQVWLIIVVFFTIARWIEDYIVVPKIIGHAVELHPLAVIFAVLCGEHLAGALGMLIAIPVAACCKLFIDFFYFHRQPGNNHPVASKPQVESEKTPVEPVAALGDQGHKVDVSSKVSLKKESTMSDAGD